MNALPILAAAFVVLATPAGDEVVSKEELRFRVVREQERDNSCGYAVLATVLSHRAATPVTEDDIIELHPREGALSFLDMRTILAAYDVTATGYRMSYSNLPPALAAAGPLVVHLTDPYAHFALLLDADSKWVLLGDPAVGTRFLDRRTLLRRWSGAVLVLEPEGVPTGPERTIADQRSRLEVLLWHAYR